MSIPLKVFFAAVIAGIVGGAGWLGRVVPFSEQWPIFEALRTTASIIFAVIGAWMAIIYPERLKLSFKSSTGTKAQSSEQAKQNSGWSHLLTPVVHSTAILCVILIIGAIAPILKHYPLPISREVLRGTCYGLLVLLTIWQLWTVLLTLVPADIVKTSLDRESSKKRTIEEMTALGSWADQDKK